MKIFCYFGTANSKILRLLYMEMDGEILTPDDRRGTQRDEEQCEV